MLVEIVDLAFAGFVAASSVALGWWLRGGGSPETKQDDEQGRHAREVLTRLHDLAARVAADVGEHSSRVEEINEELTSTGIPDTEAVVSAVDKLVRANNSMQQQLASAEDRLHEQAWQLKSAAMEARTDVLTGLANRRALDDLTAEHQAAFERSGTPFSIVMIDVDHFKKFNDKHGHQAGDEVLRGVGRILRKNTPPSGVATRYGGEEFAVVLSGVGVADATHVAERLRNAIVALRCRFAGAELQVTASAGVAQLMTGEDATAMVKRADASLYASKETGRNRTHWHDGERSRPVMEPPASSTPQAEPPKEQAMPVSQTTPAAEEPKAEPAPEVSELAPQRKAEMT